jgi:hypothetical protein
MKKLLLMFTVIFFSLNSFSQNLSSQNDIQSNIYDNENVQVKAEFSGGEKKFKEFVTENFKNPYSKDIKFEISVNFIIEIDGIISNVEIVKDAGKGTGDEMKRVLMTSPKWLSGEHEGYRVKTKVKFSLKF